MWPTFCALLERVKAAFQRSLPPILKVARIVEYSSRKRKIRSRHKSNSES